jgi:DNA-directed RNA polymerase specialized sigma subunit
MQDTIKQSSQNLLLCLREEERETKVANLQRFGEQDWREVVDEAARHQLMSMLFWELNQLSPEIVNPEDLHERLHQYILKTALSNIF